MSNPWTFDPTVPLKLSHSFTVNSSTQVEVKAQSSFQPIEESSYGAALKPTSFGVTFKWSF